MQNAASESAEYQKELWKKASTVALEKVKEAGVEIIYPEKYQFQEKVKDLYETYKQDPLKKDLIDRIQKVEG